jgi:hypothetical protein
MSKEKNERESCSSQPIFNPNARRYPLPKLKITPIREIPDDCVLVCVGPICTLACYGTGEPTLDCDIVCDDEGNCFLICPYDPNGQ